jgi:hypothetical protein
MKGQIQRPGDPTNSKTPLTARASAAYNSDDSDACICRAEATRTLEGQIGI